jgi:hypothetical protein
MRASILIAAIFSLGMSSPCAFAQGTTNPYALKSMSPRTPDPVVKHTFPSLKKAKIHEWKGDDGEIADAGAGEVVLIGDAAIFVQEAAFPANLPKGKGQMNVYVMVKNTSKSVKFDFVPWSSDSEAKLSDDIGNTYRFGRASGASSRAKSPSMYPGSVTHSAFGFEPPVKKAKALYLELPGKNFGQSATVRFKIPVAGITPEPVPAKGK